MFFHRVHNLPGRLLATLSACAFVIAGCAGAPESTTGASSTVATENASFPVTINNCGMDMTFTSAPTRAVALNQGAIEELLVLGLEDHMAGTAYLDDAVSPELHDAYASVPVLADEYPTKEVFLAANPDFAIASYSSAFDDTAVGTREELKEEGINTYLDPFGCADKSLRPAASFDNVWKSLEDVGKIFGSDKAESVISEQKDMLSTIRAQQSGAGKKVFWWDSSTDSPFAGGNAGGPAVIIDAVGATNIFADVNKSWDTVSWEQVLAADPDVIVFADASWDTAQSKIDYIENDPVLHDLTAVKNKAYVIVPFSQSTPGATLIDGAQAVSDGIAAL